MPTTSKSFEGIITITLAVGTFLAFGAAREAHSIGNTTGNIGCTALAILLGGGGVYYGLKILRR